MTSFRAFGLAALSSTFLLTSCLSDGRNMKSPSALQTAAFTSATTLPPVADDGADQTTAMSVTAPWANGKAMPIRYTCDGEAVSPPLIWTAGPLETKAYGVVLRDNDTPDFNHWVIANMSSGTTSLTENEVPAGAFVALNSAKKQSYAAPCPPKGSTHSYTLTVYALREPVAITPPALPAAVITAMDAAVLEVATTDFTYSR